jgi:hypothetical protein
VLYYKSLEEDKFICPKDEKSWWHWTANK